jgi:hypothetical protein
VEVVMDVGVVVLVTMSGVSRDSGSGIYSCIVIVIVVEVVKVYMVFYDSDVVNDCYSCCSYIVM